MQVCCQVGLCARSFYAHSVLARMKSNISICNGRSAVHYGLDFFVLIILCSNGINFVLLFLPSFIYNRIFFESLHVIAIILEKV